MGRFLRDRIRRPAKVTSGIVLKHYLGDIQKHEAIACGDGVRHMENSPGDDIKAMKKMLRDISSKFP